MPQSTSQRYQSYLIRCWKLRSATETDADIWRFALRGVSAEQQEKHFSSLEELLNYVSAELQNDDSTLSATNSA